MKNPIKVGVIIGSSSDEDAMRDLKHVFEEFSVPFAATIRSAHRTPRDVPVVVRELEKRGCEVFVAGAGMSAQLAGVIASLTIKPVIAVPLSAKKSTAVNGLDALLSCVQMPTGIPVATVAIDGAANAAYLAIAMLAISDPAMAAKLKKYRAELVLKTRQRAVELKTSAHWPD